MSTSESWAISVSGMLDQLFRSGFNGKEGGRYRMAKDDLAIFAGLTRISPQSIELLRITLYEHFDLALIELDSQVAILGISTMERYRKASMGVLETLFAGCAKERPLNKKGEE